MTTSAAVKERGEVLSADEVLALLRDGKATLRRKVKPSNSTVLGYSGKRMWSHLHFDYDRDGIRAYVDTSIPDWDYLHVPAWHPKDGPGDVAVYRVRPVWEVGERLWVREATRWQEGGIVYVADGTLTGRTPAGLIRDYCPATFMQRAASRLSFTVLSVSAEQVSGEWVWVREVEVTQ